MISLELAQKLKAAGLSWSPANNDFFMIPDRSLDEAVFVINDVTVLVEMLKGQLAVTFHGTAEWALDHMLVAELLWLPSEAQLRELLEQQLVTEPQPAVKLMTVSDGYVCEIQLRGQILAFESFGASDAYAQALLHVLESEKP